MIDLDPVEEIGIDARLDYYLRPEWSASDLKLYNKAGIEKCMHNKMNASKEESSAFAFGRYVHCLLLEPHRRDELFYIEEGVKPNSPNKAGFAADAALIEYGKMTDDIMAYTYMKHYSEKNKDRATEKGYELFKELQSYIFYLQCCGNKTVITVNEANAAATINEKVRTNFPEYFVTYDNIDDYEKKAICKGIGTLEEFEMFYSIKGIDFKSKIDLLWWDESKKLVKIIDFKTCYSAYKYSFQEDASKYGYALQMGLYYLGVYDLLTKIIGEDFYKDWKIEVELVALEKTPPYTVRKFLPSQLEYWVTDVMKVIEDFKEDLSMFNNGEMDFVDFLD